MGRRIKAAATPENLSLTATAIIDLEAKDASGSAKMPTFSILGYTGAVMNVGDYYSPVVLDLAGIKAESQTMPALLDHDTSQIVGQTESVTVDSKGVTMAGVIMGEDEAATRVKTLARNGFKWQASVGARIVRHEFVKAGESTRVNDREVSGPVLVVRESKLKEISFVALGADSGTSAAVAASSGPAKGAPSMFEKWLQARGIDPGTLDEATKAALQAAYDAEEKAKKAAPPERARGLSDVLAEHEAENHRIDEITRLTEVMLNDRPALYDRVKQLSTTAIEAKSTVQEYQIALLQIRADTSSGGRRNFRPESNAGPLVIEAAVCMSGKLRNIKEFYDQQVLNAADRQFPHGLGLMDLVLIAARENGFTSPTTRDLRSVLQFAFGEGSRMVRAAEMSTMSLPGILSNVANKFLMAGFNAVEAGWRELSVIKPVKDFKQMSSYSLTGGLQYDKVGPTGELKHGTLGELSYVDKAETYGKILGITRQDLINDDLGALTDAPKKLGRGAALKLNDVFWSTFMNNSTFFTSGRKNVVTGAGSALTSAGLSLAQTTFRKLTDADGYPTGVLPRKIAVPTELEVAANELMNSQFINTGGASTTDKVPNRNVWAGKFTVVSSSYLSNPAYTGNSATAWYLCASPDDLPLISTCFLNGREVPIVETADAEFNVLGIALRGYHDFGCNLQEYRAGVRAAGS